MLFIDPVVASDGETYERSAITRLMREAHEKHKKARHRLSDGNLHHGRSGRAGEGEDEKVSARDAPYGISPMARQAFEHDRLAPNNVLKRIICEVMESGRRRLPRKLHTASSDVVGAASVGLQGGDEGSTATPPYGDASTTSTSTRYETMQAAMRAGDRAAIRRLIAAQEARRDAGLL
jgi:hypothetical protein